MKKNSMDQYQSLIEKQEIYNFIENYEEIIEDIKIVVFDPKEKIISFNKPFSQLYYLIEGKAKISMLHEDGKNSIIQFLQAGDFIGELTLLGIEKISKDVTAINQCICIAITTSVAKEKLLCNTEFLLYMNQYLGRKLLQRTEFFAKNQNYELKNRLAAYILLTEYEGYYNEKHVETAEFLGISYRHLLYTLKNFQEDGLIVKFKKGYKIDKERLMLLSKDISKNIF